MAKFKYKNTGQIITSDVKEKIEKMAKNTKFVRIDEPAKQKKE